MIEQQYKDLFQQFRSELDANSVEGLNRHRDSAFDRFQQIGFPTSREEDYKHSNVARVFDTDLGLNLRNIPMPVNPYDTFKCDVPNLSTHLYFLINDRYYDKTLANDPLPDGVFVGSLQRFSEDYPDIFNANHGQIADYSDNGVVAYNTMFAQDGFCCIRTKECDGGEAIAADQHPAWWCGLERKPSPADHR